MPRVFVVGTADTKPQELAYVADLLRQRLGSVCVVNVGTRPSRLPVDVSAQEVAAFHPDGAAAVLDLDDRGAAVTAMGLAFSRFLSSRHDIAGVIGIGGGGGTSIITAGMRELAYGIPKVMVSTMASGDVAPYVGISDIVMIPAVTDLAGLNTLNRVVLHNAAEAMAAMVSHPPPRGTDKPAIGLTMFGVTTPCVTAIVNALGSEHDCLVFHATGIGGRTMEKIADSGMLAGFIDITTTEVADLLLGGVLPATDDRFGAVARTGLPWVGSVGALDMVNFGPIDTVPVQQRGRNLYRHNPQVTLMRTTAEECRRISAWIAGRLNLCHGPVRLLLPERGISALDVDGREFHDPEADEALFCSLESELSLTDLRQVFRLPYHINDPEFAAAAVRHFREASAAR